MFMKFSTDRRATIAVITAIMLPVLVLIVGVPIDLARTIQYRATLQNVADQAALAGSEALRVGANPAQACNLTLAYVNVPITNGELPAGATPSATLTSPGGYSYLCNGAAALSTPQITLATAPDMVAVTIAGSQPTTFMAVYQASVPVKVSAGVIGPQGFITICIDPSPNASGDLSQVYYYLRNSSGTLVNQDGTTVNPSSSNTLPGAAGGVSLAAFLGDDSWVNESPPLATDGYCNAPTNSEVAVLVKPGLAQRLGFAYYVVTAGQLPCYPDPTFNYNGANAFYDFKCLKGNVNYAYNPYYQATSIGGFFAYYQTNTVAGDYFLPNAYGSPIGWVNAFYSTDYPASLNSNNYYKNTGGTVVSPTGSDACFTTYASASSNVVNSVANGYTAASQTCLINEAATTLDKAMTKTFAMNIYPYNYFAKGNVAYWENWYPLQGYGGSTATGTDMVCLVANGASYTPTLTTTSSGTSSQYSTAKVGSGVAVQQENFLIANSSVAPNVYHCPVNTLGSPFYPDPTCAELAGASLQIGWNDMGGILYDNGNYVDLVYSYSCQPPAAGAIINSAVIQ
jgi:Flp pilus assembly protein TadG